MSVEGEPIEIHVGEDITFEADYDTCEEATAPDLTGMTFQFIMTPKDGTGGGITKTCTVNGTKISWALVSADYATRLDEVFRCQLRRVDSGFNRVWKTFDAKIVD